jgi:argininosuccinate lyase
MEAACIGGCLEATDAAEYLVRRGLPFREAHEAAAAIVRDCIAAGQNRITARSLGELKAHSPLFEADIYQALSPAACVAARNLPGGPAPREVRRQIRTLRRQLNP